MTDSCDCFRLVRFSHGEEADQIWNFLSKVKDLPDHWDELYRCKACSQFWKVSYPAAGEVCCVEPEFNAVRDDAAR